MVWRPNQSASASASWPRSRPHGIWPQKLASWPRIFTVHIKTNVHNIAIDNHFCCVLVAYWKLCSERQYISLHAHTHWVVLKRVWPQPHTLWPQPRQKFWASASSSASLFLASASAMANVQLASLTSLPRPLKWVGNKKNRKSVQCLIGEEMLGSQTA